MSRCQSKIMFAGGLEERCLLVEGHDGPHTSANRHWGIDYGVPDSMSDDEIRELLCATLHGPLPNETMQRVLATLSEVPALRETARKVREETTAIRRMVFLYGKDAPHSAVFGAACAELESLGLGPG